MPILHWLPRVSRSSSINSGSWASEKILKKIATLTFRDLEPCRWTIRLWDFSRISLISLSFAVGLKRFGGQTDLHDEHLRPQCQTPRWPQYSSSFYFLSDSPSCWDTSSCGFASPRSSEKYWQVSSSDRRCLGACHWFRI